MGTRHLIAVQYKKQYKIAQYGQWDGYLEGQGASILNFLTNDFDKNQFISNLEKCRYITDKEYTSRWKEFGIDLTANTFVNMDISNKFYAKFPELNRDIGSDILQMVQEADGGLVLKDSINFAYDGLYCEYGYVIDLDKNTFEVYSAFNNKCKMNKNERFYQSEPTKYNSCEYYPIRLVELYDLSNLPDDKEFFRRCNKILGQDDD
jgi:hypothetical protein